MMKFIAMLLVFVAGGGSVYLLTNFKDVNTLKEKQPLYWVNPMDPADKRPSPAKDTMGMDFIPVYEEKAQGQGSAGTVTISPEIQQNLGKVRTSIPRTKNENFSHLISMGYQ